MLFMPELIIGTRTSALALWQTNHIIAQLQAVWPELVCTRKTFVTQGDKTQAQGKPLPEIGGKGLFTAELEGALLAGEIDLAVHSLKDLPVENSPGLTIGAICSRADVRDGLVARNGWTVATLPQGAVVGTSSTRRAAQLLAYRPDLVIKSIRGNVDTRVRKVMSGEYDATLLAAAGLERLGMEQVISEWLTLDVMLPAPGQGALAVQCRANDATVLAFLSALEDASVRAAVTVERTFLSCLGGGCSAPVAAYAQPLPDGQLQMQALVATPDGQRVIRVQGVGEATLLGSQLAQQALAQGAAQFLAAVENTATPIPPAPEPKPLQGKRIVITRPREQSDDLAEKLMQLGATPLVMPVMRIVPLPDLRPLDQAIQQLHHYQWLIFTSTNSVDLFWERFAVSGQSTAVWQEVQVAAVGPTTAAAVRTHAVEPAFVPSEHLAEAVADGLGDVTERHVLLPQAAIARPALTEILTQRGAHVDAIPVYQTIGMALDEANLAELRQGVDAIIFTSGSTVRNFLVAIAGDAAIAQQLHQTLLTCIGPQTAQSAQAAGLAVGVVATEYTVEGLVSALVQHFTKEQA